MQIEDQKILHKLYKQDKNFRYPVMEHFYTLQGEGFHTGSPAYFVRLGGCDVGCVWCDVKDSWSADVYPQLKSEEILKHISNSRTHMVVVTGGEPAIYDLRSLTNSLKKEGFRLHIETSGAYPITGDWNWICVSPKKFKLPLKENLQRAHELKVIVYNRHDFIFAGQMAQHVSEDCKLFLQPEWDKRVDMMPLILDYIKKNPEWRISLQTHKFLNIP